MEPAITAASSDRISPNMFSVTITSNWRGLRISCIAQLSTNMCSSVTWGNSRATSVTVFRQSCELLSTLALSIEATFWRRPAAA